MPSSRPRLLMLITEDWYFWSHRLDLARAALSAGYEVCLATRVRDHGPRIEAEGIRLLPLSLERRSRKPLQEWATIAELVRIYKREKPTIVHHVALKPILYGAVAARLAAVPAVINAFAGLGAMYIGEGVRATAARSVLGVALRWALGQKNSVTVFQNEDDRQLLVSKHILADSRTRIIRGAGVHLGVFRPSSSPVGRPIVLLAARMLWDKGVGEFVEAARLLKSQGSNARFVLVGQADHENPRAIPDSQLSSWVNSGVVEWWGHQETMAEVLSRASIVVLPSYREGLPKVLLEAAACARPVVATDVPGCREIVRPPLNGLLVAPKVVEPLAGAIARLEADPILREEMGRKGRQMVEREFSAEAIASQTLGLYHELLDQNRKIGN